MIEARKRRYDADGKEKEDPSKPTKVPNASADTVSIAIVGGGIAGLSCALALQRRGFKVAVFERDTTFSDRRQGYGLTLVNNPKGPLAELGLLDRCIKEDCPSNAHWLFRPEGTILGYYGRSFKPPPVAEAVSSSGTTAKVEGRGNLRIPRQNLRKMMMEMLLPGTVQWGMKIVDYEEHDDHVSIQFQRQQVRQSSSAEPEDEVTLTTVTADVLVGADGIRSIVRQLRAQKPGRVLSGGGTSSSSKPLGEASPLRYTTIAVILGITTASHPLITQQGFYCLDGENRLFTMPFEEEESSSSSGSSSSGASSSGSGGTDSSSSGAGDDEPALRATRLTMWQLSFSGLSEEQALQWKAASPTELLAEARRRTAGWFEPVHAMIDGTPPGEVWGTGLYDRDPMTLWGGDRGSRVTVVGDACHPMSMFKGQGANQALQDGPLLASWLQRDGAVATSRNLYTRLKCFEREMVARTSSKVQASREAAVHLHSPAVLADECGVEGVPAGLMREVLGRLRSEGVGAGLDGGLVEGVQGVIAAVGRRSSGGGASS